MYLVHLFSLLTLLFISRCRRKDLEQRPRSWKRKAARAVQKYPSAAILRARLVNAAKNIHNLSRRELFLHLLLFGASNKSAGGACDFFGPKYHFGISERELRERQRHGRAADSQWRAAESSSACWQFLNQTAKKIHQTKVKNARDDGKRLWVFGQGSVKRHQESVERV